MDWMKKFWSVGKTVGLLYHFGLNKILVINILCKKIQQSNAFFKTYPRGVFSKKNKKKEYIRGKPLFWTKMALSKWQMVLHLVPQPSACICPYG